MNIQADNGVISELRLDARQRCVVSEPEVSKLT